MKYKFLTIALLIAAFLQAHSQHYNNTGDSVISALHLYPGEHIVVDSSFPSIAAQLHLAQWTDPRYRPYLYLHNYGVRPGWRLTCLSGAYNIFVGPAISSRRE